MRRIAVLRANAIGDFVVALPALEALRAAYPDAEITYLGADWHVTWLCARPGPWNRVESVPVGADRGDRPVLAADSPQLDRFLKEQQARRYDLVVQAHGGGASSNPFASRLGARVTVGSRAPDAPPLDRWVPYAEHHHEVLRLLEVVSLVGAVPVTLQPRLAVTDRDRKEAAEVLPPDRRPLVAVHAGATDPRRRWPPRCFAAVAEALVRRGARVVLVGAPADTGLSIAVRQHLHHDVEDVTGQLSLSGTTGLLERCALLVGNDSGPRHLAAAVGAATVGVFWCVNLITDGPLTRARHRVGVSFECRCPACGQDQLAGRCEHDPSLVASVPVAEIRRHALDLLGAT